MNHHRVLVITPSQCIPDLDSPTNLWQTPTSLIFFYLESRSALDKPKERQKMANSLESYITTLSLQEKFTLARNYFSLIHKNDYSDYSKCFFLKKKKPLRVQPSPPFPHEEVKEQSSTSQAMLLREEKLPASPSRSGRVATHLPHGYGGYL